MKLPDEPGIRTAAGFTRIEVVTLVGALVLGVTLQLPLAATGRLHGETATCLSNLRQVQRAWMLYALDHGGRLIPSYTADTTTGGESRDWAAGAYLDFNAGNPGNWDTNRFPGRSPLRRYVEGPNSIFRCPSDPARVRLGTGSEAGRWVPRTRSISLNNWVGGPAWAASGVRGQVFETLEALVDPGPARTLTFLDEREDSINDGYLAIDLAGYPANGAQARLIDYPAYWHDRAASVAFADGRVEVRRWEDPRTVPAPGRGPLVLNVPSPNNRDVFWLQDHATRPVSVP